MAKQGTKTWWRDRADKFFSLWIRDRDQVCVANRVRTEKCESPRYLQCAHVFSRAHLSVRYDPANAVALCRSCHMYYENRPLEWKAFVQGYEDDDGQWIDGHLMTPEDYYRLEVRAYAGDRSGVRPDYEAEANFWETQWITGNRSPKTS